jgi:hypothetical protein
MASDDEVNVDNIESFRLFSVKDDPDYMVLRIETRDGRAFNFGLARKHFSHVVEVWNHDLAAIDTAIANGQPIPETAKQQG